MSKRPASEELPRDAHVMMALRRELNRNSRQITQAFWQEFEQIRSQQRQQLMEERTNRERISTLMRDANQEAQQQAEALSRSISSHGINPGAPSPRMRREPLAIMPATEETKQNLKSSLKSSARPKDLGRRGQQTQSSATNSTHVPRAPPSSRATIMPGTPSMRTPPRTSPNISKLQLTQKPK